MTTSRPARLMNSQAEYDHMLRPGQGVLHLTALLKSAAQKLEKSDLIGLMIG